MTDNSKETWESSFTINASAPALSVKDVYVRDLHGNNNGEFDPGETVQLFVTVQNDGESSISSVFGELQSLDSGIFISGSTSLYPWLQASGGKAVAQFTVYADGNVPPGHLVNYNLAISHTSGFSDLLTFDLKVGNVAAYIWDPNDKSSSTAVIRDFYANSGLTVEEGTQLPSDLSKYQKIFVLLGIYIDNHQLSASEGNSLKAYLEQGGNIYMEGGDTWAYDLPATSVHPLFHINGITDGSDDTQTIVGVEGTFTEGLQFNYTGPNNYMDRLEAIGDAVVILKNTSPTAYDNAICYTNDTYSTVGASFELGGLNDSTSRLFLESYLSEVDKFLDKKAQLAVPTLFNTGFVLILLSFSILLGLKTRNR